jgi:hypothetical protein
MTHEMVAFDRRRFKRRIPGNRQASPRDEHPHSGPGGVRPELKKMLRHLLDEFPESAQH